MPTTSFSASEAATAAALADFAKRNGSAFVVEYHGKYNTVFRPSFHAFATLEEARAEVLRLNSQGFTARINGF